MLSSVTVDAVPLDLISHLLSFLDCKALARASAVNRVWREAAVTLWGQAFRTEWGGVMQQLFSCPVDNRTFSKFQAEPISKIYSYETRFQHLVRQVADWHIVVYGRRIAKERMQLNGNSLWLWFELLLSQEEVWELSRRDSITVHAQLEGSRGALAVDAGPPVCVRVAGLSAGVWELEGYQGQWQQVKGIGMSVVRRWGPLSLFHVGSQQVALQLKLALPATTLVPVLLEAGLKAAQALNMGMALEGAEELERCLLRESDDLRAAARRLHGPGPPAASADLHAVLDFYSRSGEHKGRMMSSMFQYASPLPGRVATYSCHRNGIFHIIRAKGAGGPPVVVTGPPPDSDQFLGPDDEEQLLGRDGVADVVLLDQGGRIMLSKSGMEMMFFERTGSRMWVLVTPRVNSSGAECEDHLRIVAHQGEPLCMGLALRVSGS